MRVRAVMCVLAGVSIREQSIKRDQQKRQRKHVRFTEY